MGLFLFAASKKSLIKPFDTFLYVQADRQERANSVQFKPKFHTWAGFGNIVNNECLVLWDIIQNTSCNIIFAV